MTSPCRIALVGATGRMGLEIARAARQRRDVCIAAAVERNGSPAIGADLGEMAGMGPIGAVVGADFSSAFSQADVVVDLSLPEATASVVEAAREAGKPLVCGTTGVSEAVLGLFDVAAREIPILYTSNLSPGVAVVRALVRQAAIALGNEYDIEIVEMHHRDKVDAPSGTALLLARAAAESQGSDPGISFCYGRSGRTGPRPGTDIGIHAVRGGGVFGEHTVIFAGQHERIEITHRASSRALFAQGALAAARFLAGQSPGRYHMADVLGL